MELVAVVGETGCKGEATGVVVVIAELGWRQWLGMRRDVVQPGELSW